MRFRCPHCGTSSVVRTSMIMSPTVTWLYVQCRRLECGHTWRVDAEATMTISPSAQPNPHVQMLVSQHVRRDLVAIQMANAQTGDPKLPGPQQLELIELQDSDRPSLPDHAPALTRP